MHKHDGCGTRADQRSRLASKSHALAALMVVIAWTMTAGVTAQEAAEREPPEEGAPPTEAAAAAETSRDSVDGEAAPAPSPRAPDDIVYEFAYETPIWECATPRARGALPTTTPYVGSKFTIVSQRDGITMIRFLRWDSEDEGTELNRRFVWQPEPAEAGQAALGEQMVAARTQRQPDDLHHQRHWCMDTEQISTYVVESLSHRAAFRASAVLIPYKMRFGRGSDRQFDVESDVSLSVGFGAGWNVSRSVNIGLVGFLGPSIVEIADTDGDGSTKRGAFTMGAGLTARLAGVDLALLLGFDLLVRRGDVAWPEHGRPWLGLAIGVNIFQGEARQENESSPED